MSFFEQTRYYFNDVLPDIIVSNLAQINNILYSYWSVFFIINIVFFIIIIRLLRKKQYLELENKNFDKFFQVDLNQKVIWYNIVGKDLLY